MKKEAVFYATGKRKNALAKTWLRPGTGRITVNNKPADEYFTVQSMKMLIVQPLALTNTAGSYDVRAQVTGGGTSGQAGAIRHGITRALLQANPELRVQLKRAGFVRRDSRMKERKKYGQRGARARFQFSKR